MSDFGFILSDSEVDVNDALFGEAMSPEPDPVKKAGRATKIDELVKEIEIFYMGIGASLMMSQKTADDGMAIMQNAPKVAEAWRDPITRNLKVRKMWEKMFMAQGYSGLAMAHFPILLAVAKNHNLSIPGKKVKKEVMEDA